MLMTTFDVVATVYRQLLSVLSASEEEIKTRSKAVESHWSPDKYQDKSSGKMIFLLETQNARENEASFAHLNFWSTSMLKIIEKCHI